jgi:hypothetical protein
MGLDMFLFKVKKGQSYKNSKEEIAYWRKANAVHAWFDNYCANGEMQDCEMVPVSKCDLHKLKNDCKIVLDNSNLTFKTIQVEEYDSDKGKYVKVSKMARVIDDPSLAEELIPTQSGFFFGSTLYDSYYLENLRDTIKQITNVLESVDFDKYDVYYLASW